MEVEDSSTAEVQLDAMENEKIAFLLKFINSKKIKFYNFIMHKWVSIIEIR